MGCTWLHSCLLLPVLCLAVAVDIELELGTDRDWDWDWGSGLQELLHSFPADSPFVTETADRPANCSQRFWLPPSSPICWDNIVGPEEFEQSRLLALQNRAALRAVAEASGVAEGGVSYNQQAREDQQGFRADQLSFEQTAGTMQNVFLSLEEKRRDGTELWTFSLKEQLGTTKDSIHSRQHLTDLLEKQVNHLERLLNTLQL
uniref:Si:ch211-57n23.1 n=1 Tax=Paramormyrops kingsleyae TaxID=1676925 RepID=A0A3B3RAV0_9TELE